MAIAGFPNVPMLESNIRKESLSSSSGRRRSRGNISTRAFSILRRWRELEDECAMNRVHERERPRVQREGIHGISSHQEGEIRGGLRDSSEIRSMINNSASQTRHVTEQRDNQSFTSEQSQDLGEVERVRVQNIFRERMSSGRNGETPNGGHISRGLRVRVVRDWIQTSNQQREARVGRRRENQVAEITSQIEQARIEQVINHDEGQPENSQRQITSGQQREAYAGRRREDQVVEVASQIEQAGNGQSLNRNEDQPENNRRQITSGQQREAYVGRRREDQVVEVASQIEQASNGQSLNRNEDQPENSRRQIRKLRGRQALLDLMVKNEQERREELRCLRGTRPVSGFAHRNRIQSLLRFRCLQNRRRSTELRMPSSIAENELGLLRQRQTVTGLREGFMSRMDNNAHIQASDASDASSDNDSDALRDDRSHANSPNEALDVAHEQNEPLVEALHVSQDLYDSVEDVNVAPSTSSPGVDLSAGPLTNLNHLTDDIVGSSPDISRIGSSRQFTVLEERCEIIHEEYSDREEANVENELDDQVNISENLIGQELNVHGEDWQEQVSEFEMGRESSTLSNQWRDDQVETDRLHWLGDGEYQSPEANDNEADEQIDQDDFWLENASQETPRDWLRMASDRVDLDYFSDDDNMHHIELRELVNRRRVSSLLDSNFRDSLDRLIQSYAERQSNIPDDWDLQEMLPPPFVLRNQELLLIEQEDGSRPNDTSVPPLPPLPPPLPQAYRGQGRHQWPGTKWEIVNDLRIDMARLQHKLNNMERMLEACMDMQLELQRSVRQEVSAALNRSLNPSELVESILPKDSFKWESVRKSVCCMCSNTNINSLLYRCGHICTCTKCSEALLQGNGKCPMCQAPVIEVIRAYFIQE